MGTPTNSSPVAHRAVDALRRWPELTCSCLAYVMAGMTVPYLLLFAGGLFVPKTVDTGAASLDVGALALDCSLLLLFGVQHSVMARPAVRARVGRLLSPAVERSVYVMCASGVLILLMALWRPSGGAVWDLTGLAASAARLVFWAGFGLVYLSTFWLDHLHLLGLKQAWMGVSVGAEAPPRLCTSGPYRLVRNPLMLGLIVAFLSTPRMTTGHLLFGAFMALYALVGIHFEERRLAGLFGDEYIAYRDGTPMLIPSVHLRRRPWPTAATAPSGGARAPSARPVPRTPDIEFSSDLPHFWYHGCPFGTALLDAYSVLFPPIEAFMISHVRAASGEVVDPELADQTRGFLGQEAIHARLHRRSMQLLERQGYDVDRPARALQAIVDGVLEPLSQLTVRLIGPGFVLAIIAGVEHWTATIAEVMLDGDYGAPGFGPMKELYYWHGAEELEHKAVVFDILRSRSRSYALRVVGLLFATFVFVALSSLAMAMLVAQAPRVHRLGPSGFARFVGRFVEGAWLRLLTRERLLVWGASAFWRYLRPGFHPSDRNTSHLVLRGLAALERDAPNPDRAPS